MLVAVCLILNLMILAYLGKKEWKGIYNVYFSFLVLTALSSFFFVDVYELQESLKEFLGTNAYFYLKLMITGNTIIGLSPLFAIVLVTFILGFVLSVFFAFDVYQKIHNESEFVDNTNNGELTFSFVGCSKKNVKRKYAFYCSYLC